MDILLAIPLSLGITFFASLIIGQKVGYPNHRRMAFGVYLLSWIPLGFAAKQYWGLLGNYQVEVIFGNWLIILGGILLVMIGYSLWLLFRVDRAAINALPRKRLPEVLEEDEHAIKYINTSMHGIIEQMNAVSQNSSESSALSSELKTTVTELWTIFLQHIYELDIIKKRYTAFYRINLLRRSKLHYRAFVLTYTAHLLQYTFTLQLTKLLRKKTMITRFMDEQHDLEGLDVHTYSQLKSKLTQTQDIIRLSVGRAYIASRKSALLSASSIMDITGTHLKSIRSSLKSYPNLIKDRPLDFFEKAAFKSWYPIQKGISVQLSHIRTTRRKYFVTPKQLSNYKDQLTPGDLMLTRREWKATILGIPGYWTHSAMYIGTLQQLETYLSEEEYAELNLLYPEVMQHMATPDNDGYARSVIEVLRPGVIIQSLETSARCDSLAVLQPRTSKQNRIAAIRNAFAHFGKPYDYNFDFVNNDALVCSELLYKSYKEAEDVTITPYMFNGRLLYSPNQFAKKFAAEYNTPHQELDLLLFLDGNEQHKKAIKKGLDEFLDSYKRPKWYAMEAYLYRSTEQ